MESFEIIWQGVAAAAGVMALTWGTMEWVIPVAHKHLRRGLSVVVGIVMVCILQEAHFVHFGMTHDGGDEHNVLAAIMFGILAGGLAPIFHTQIVNRFAKKLKKGRK